MDYLGWELERQRAALAALLLGGGEARGGENAREEGRRSPAGFGTARGRAVRDAGRYAEGGYIGGTGADPAAGAWEMVRDAGRFQETERAGTVETPVSAWETVLGAEETGGAFRRNGGGAETGAQAGSGKAARRTAREPMGGGTGAQAGLSRFSRNDEVRREEPEAGGAAETGAESAAGRRRSGGRSGGEALGGGEAAGAVLSGAASGGGEAGPDAAGDIRSAGELGRETDTARSADGAFWSLAYGIGPVRRDGGGKPAAPGEDGGTVGGISWGGGWETAALREEDGARALSRAVQRDARRYDGGFILY